MSLSHIAQTNFQSSSSLTFQDHFTQLTTLRSETFFFKLDFEITAFSWGFFFFLLLLHWFFLILFAHFMYQVVLFSLMAYYLFLCYYCVIEMLMTLNLHHQLFLALNTTCIFQLLLLNISSQMSVLSGNFCCYPENLSSNVTTSGILPLYVVQV